jgi:hypothetical protein
MHRDAASGEPRFQKLDRDASAAKRHDGFPDWAEPKPLARDHVVRRKDHTDIAPRIREGPRERTCHVG